MGPDFFRIRCVSFRMNFAMLVHDTVEDTSGSEVECMIDYMFIYVESRILFWTVCTLFALEVDLKLWSGATPPPRL